MTPDRSTSRSAGACLSALPLALGLLCDSAAAQFFDLNKTFDVWQGYCASRIVSIAEDRALRCPGQFIEFNKLLAAVMTRELDTGQTNRTALAPPGSNAAGGGTNLSRDGTCVVGYQDAGNGTPYHALRWTEAGGPVDLGTLDPPNNASRMSDAAAVSDDCNVIVGSSQYNSAQHAYRWTASGGMVDLGAPAGAGRNSRAFGVSAAGDVVVGDAEFVDSNAFSGFRTGAFRWTAAGGFQSLGALEPGFPTSATRVTADGSAVVGSGGVSVTVGSTQTNGSRAFRWTQAGGLVPIGPLPGHRYADAAGVSDNGAIVVGTSSTGPLDRNAVGGELRGSGTAFRWTQATGIQDLRQLLVAAGIDMTGVALLSVTGMSADGQWITGLATTPTTPAGETVGYIVRYCDAACGQVGAAQLNLNQNGLSGSWYNPPTDGQGIELEFFVNAVAAGTGLVQGAWFTFDNAVVGGAERQRWYTFSGNVPNGSSSVPVRIYQNTGGNFLAPPITNGVEVGTGTLAMTSCTAGTFDYAFTDGTGRTGSVALTRVTQNVTCAASGTPQTNADFGFSGNWYDPATSGQGFVFELNPTQSVLFITWYTYAPAGQASGAAGQRWFTGLGNYTPGGRTIALTLYQTTGGLFNQPTTPPPQSVAVGTGTVTFSSCGTASMTYNFTGGIVAGRSGTLSLVRVGPTPPGCGP